jgi:uncharacterized protein (TIGR00369 family)
MAEPQGEVLPEAPPGFQIRATRGKFTRHNGPTFEATAPGDLRQGMWVLGRHCNGMGFMHGGMFCAFADSAVAMASFQATKKSGVTIKLTVEYFDIVHEGTWIEAHPQVTMQQGDLVHITAPIVKPDGTVVARATAIFRTVNRKPKPEA